MRGNNEKTSKDLNNNNVLINQNDSDIKKYDLVFIGGGPATIAFICHVFQHKLSEKIFQSSNILIIEKNENFGSGCLGSYGINTNTSSEGFPRLICQTEYKEKYIKEGLSPSKQPMKVSKNYNQTQNLKNNNSFKLKKENTTNQEKVNQNKREKISILKSNQRKFSNKISNLNNLTTKHKNSNEIHLNKPSSDIEENSNDVNNLLNIKEKIMFRPSLIFSEIFNSSCVQTLLKIGNRPAPLTLVGYYLDCLGNFLVDYINSKYNKNILLNKAEVKQIKIFNNQEFGILSTRNSETENNKILIKAKYLVIATGGKQDENNPYYFKIIGMKGKDNVFSSDFILKEIGYEKFMMSIVSSFIDGKNLNLKNEEKNFIKKKIVIIGGSHSGFSSAWILLNDPSSYQNIKIGNDYKPKYNPNCPDCVKYMINDNNFEKKSSLTNHEISTEKVSSNENIGNYYNIDRVNGEKKDYKDKEINLENYHQENNNSKPCKCLGEVQNHIWNFDLLNNLEDLNLIGNEIRKIKNNYDYKFNSNTQLNDNLNKKNENLNDVLSFIKNNLLDISILYRDHIRVHYSSETEALEDNYTEYNKKEAVNKQGKIYPFIGIRGDAKELYRQIIKGEEKRIKLIKTSNNDEQKKYIQEADYVIWACGYKTNNIKILDNRNHTVDFFEEETGIVEVSKQLNILNKNSEPIKNLFGIGQGFSTKAPELINGKKARADSIHLYNTHIAQRLYNSLQFIFTKNNIDFHIKITNGNINNNLNGANLFINKKRIEKFNLNIRNNNEEESKNKEIKQNNNTNFKKKSVINFVNKLSKTTNNNLDGNNKIKAIAGNVDINNKNSNTSYLEKIKFYNIGNTFVNKNVNIKILEKNENDKSPNFINKLESQKNFNNNNSENLKKIIKKKLNNDFVKHSVDFQDRIDLKIKNEVDHKVYNLDKDCENEILNLKNEENKLSNKTFKNKEMIDSLYLNVLEKEKTYVFNNNNNKNNLQNNNFKKINFKKSENFNNHNVNNLVLNDITNKNFNNKENKKNLNIEKSNIINMNSNNTNPLLKNIENVINNIQFSNDIKIDKDLTTEESITKNKIIDVCYNTKDICDTEKISTFNYKKTSNLNLPGFNSLCQINNKFN